MTVGVQSGLKQLDSLQRDGKRSTCFDCGLLQKQKAGDAISPAELAKSLQWLVANRKSNQKLDVMTIRIAGGQYIETLYLVDRTSNPIERRLFRPGLLHKLA